MSQALRRVYEPTTRSPVPWLLSGEAALALQGVDLEPSRIEFRAASPFAAAYFARLMKPYESPAGRVTVLYGRSDTPPPEGWRSNALQRLVSWTEPETGETCWLGRWCLASAAVEVLYTDAIDDPLARMRPGVVKKASFEGMRVAVVPLEFLLAGTAVYEQTGLMYRILRTLRTSGHSPEDLQAALRALPAGEASRLLRLLEIGLVAG